MSDGVKMTLIMKITKYKKCPKCGKRMMNLIAKGETLSNYHYLCESCGEEYEG
jgi:predicted RNA-binding Zn-ribbon protein involved in translation (DUF1610 family)